MKIIHVVAAALKDTTGRVLINQRPVGKPWAGYWEFPGGKIEAGETTLAALKRELHEELGLTVHDAKPWMHLSHDYPEHHVELEVWRVLRYSGKARGCEEQALAWARPDELPGRNLLPADAPIVTALRLPSQMLVTPSPGPGATEFLTALERALIQGVQFVQFRAPTCERSGYLALAKQVVASCRQYGARVVLNQGPAVARETAADGVHLNGMRLAKLTARPLPASRLVGASCHDERQILHALDLGVDYLVLGPVLTTPTHPGAETLGWEHFARLAAASRVPVYAIGGMAAEHLGKVRELGGHGIAAVRALWDNQPLPSS